MVLTPVPFVLQFLFDELLVEGLCPESKFSIVGNTRAGVGVGTDSGPAIGPILILVLTLVMTLGLGLELGLLLGLIH